MATIAVAISRLRSTEKARVLRTNSETMAEEVNPASNASQLQEAIDVIVRTFDHPPSLSLDYSFDDGTKRTTFEIGTPDGETTYELRYEGRDDEEEPELVRHE